MPKYKKEDIEKYYEMLGLDPNEEGLIKRDSINLLYIGDLYELNEFDKKLSYTSKDLSDSYSLLVQMIRDGFWYDTKKRREQAFEAALDVIDDLTKFDIEAIDNPELTTDRMNSLKTTIINGLCSVGDLTKFRMYQKNSSFASLYLKICDIENEEECKEKLCIEEDKTPKDLKKLYYLMAYSKFVKDGSDFEMFDGTGKITLQRIRYLVRRNLRENISTDNGLCDEIINEQKKLLRVSHYNHTNNNPSE